MGRPAKTSTEKVIEACDYFLARGERPMTDSVMAYLHKKYGQGVSKRELSPTLKAWKEKHHCSVAVDRLAEAYFALNEEEQAGFRNRIGVMPKTERSRTK